MLLSLRSPAILGMLLKSFPHLSLSPHSSPTSSERSQHCLTAETHSCSSFTCYKSSWKWTRQTLEVSKADGTLSSVVSAQQDTWVQAHLTTILLQRTYWQGHVHHIVRLVHDASYLVGALFFECKIYTRMCFTVNTFLRVVIYKIFSFLEKLNIHSAGPKMYSVLTLL